MILFGVAPSTARADDSVEFVHPYKTPSGPGASRDVFGVRWVTLSSYKKQPESSYVTKPGIPVTISTELDKNGLSSIFIGYRGFDGANYFWYQKLPNRNWELVTNKNKYTDAKDKSINADLNRPYYSFTSDTPGIYYFQASAHVIPYGWSTLKLMDIFNPVLYSNLTSITVANSDIATDKINIDTDSDYLINNGDTSHRSTFAHAQTYPSDATDKKDIRWSTDSNLITIDKISGEIYLKQNNNKSGIATIKASLTNADGKGISAQKDISVGNMLTITNHTGQFHPGDSALLQLHGDYPDAKNITWYKNSKPIDSHLYESDYHYLQLTNLKEINNNDKYFVIVTLPQGKKDTKTLKSNVININLNNGPAPEFESEHTISDDSYPEATISSNEISDVETNDKIIHTISLKRTKFNPADKDIKSATLFFPLSPNEEILPDGIEINNHSVSSSDVHIDKENIVSINNKLPNAEISSFQIKTKITSLKTSKSFKYEPQYTMTMNNSSIFWFTDFLPTNISFTIDGISLFKSKIDFGNISIPKYSSQIVYRHAPSEQEPIIEFIDNRRKKNPITLKLNYSGKFTAQNDKNLINNHLKMIYFNAEQNMIIPSSDNITIEKTNLGEPLDDVYWDKNEGLLLAIKNANFPSGHYESSITWIISNSV